MPIISCAVQLFAITSTCAALLSSVVIFWCQPEAVELRTILGKTGTIPSTTATKIPSTTATAPAPAPALRAVITVGQVARR